MHPDLERARDTLRAATAGLDPASLARHTPGKWSAGQILEHLAKGYASTAYILNRCLEADAPKARPSAWRERLATLVVVGLGYLPSGRQAPEVTRPAARPPDDIVDQAIAALQALDETAARAETRFGPATALANHPILGPLNTREWRRFHLVHTRHHVKQIARLRERMPGEAVTLRS
jgi:hypothetical protein